MSTLNQTKNPFNAVDTNEGKLILDSHKLSHHYDRVKDWENGEQIAPVSVDMALTRACGAMCSFCYAVFINCFNFCDILDLVRAITSLKTDVLCALTQFFCIYLEFYL